MADINMTPLGGLGRVGDRFLVCEGMPGIKKCSVREISPEGYNLYTLEFPEIGHSLPALFERDFRFFEYAENIYQYGNISGNVDSVLISIIEYGGQPDPRYFNISAVDEDGKPVYAEE